MSHTYLITRQIIRLLDVVDAIEETRETRAVAFRVSTRNDDELFGGIDQLIFARSFKTGLDAGILPEDGGVVEELGREIEIQLVRVGQDVFRVRGVVRVLHWNRWSDLVHGAKDTLAETLRKIIDGITANLRLTHRVCCV